MTKNSIISAKLVPPVWAQISKLWSARGQQARQIMTVDMSEDLLGVSRGADGILRCSLAGAQHPASVGNATAEQSRGNYRKSFGTEQSC